MIMINEFFVMFTMCDEGKPGNYVLSFFNWGIIVHSFNKSFQKKTYWSLCHGGYMLVSTSISVIQQSLAAMLLSMKDCDFQTCLQ